MTHPGGMQYRVDDLAREARTTVRNVRAYQDRGLLPAPRRAGRVAIYDESHLIRLRLIGSLLDRGFTLANIGELIDNWEGGRDIGDLIGLGQQIVGPFSDEVADRGTPAEISERYGLPTDDMGAAVGALEHGLIVIEGELFVVPSPRLLRAGLELHRAGVPFAELFAELRQLRADAEAIAERFVRLVVTNVFEPHFVDGAPDPDQVPALTEALGRIRPLATTVVTVELARALQARSQAELGARLAALVVEDASVREP